MPFKMVNYIKNIFSLPLFLFEISNSMRFQKRFIRKYLKPEIDVFLTENDGSLTKEDVERMLNFYALVVPAFCERLFYLLRGESLSHKEKLSITYLASLTGLFDDLFDEKNVRESRIKQLLENSLESTGNTSEKLMLYLWKRANENVVDTTLLKQNATSVFNAQHESQKQKTNVLSKEELKQITLQKGGVSLVFYFSVLDKILSEEERKLLHLFGAFIQLSDDLFDVYKDYTEGINTIVTKECDIKNLFTLYESLINEFQEEVYHSQIKTKNKKAFLRYFNFIASRGLVCLDMLQKRQQETSGVFAVGTYSRKDLICDMEKPINFLKFWHHYAKLMSRLPKL